MPRADAQRNLDALLAVAQEQFATRGVDVNVRAVAARTGWAPRTLHRHFPQRSLPATVGSDHRGVSSRGGSTERPTRAGRKISRGGSASAWTPAIGA